MPVLKKQEKEKWGRLSPELRDELIKRVSRFGLTLTEAADSLTDGAELARPDAKLAEKLHVSLASFKEAADQPAVAAEFERALASWVNQVQCITQRHAARARQRH